MAWARMDDGFHDHPKVGGLTLGAVGLWTLCFTWCNRHLGADDLPPGFVPTHQPKRFGGTTRQVAELVAAGLWETTDGGWVFHDFEDYLPESRRPSSMADVSAARSEAGKKGAAKRWHSDDNPDGKLLSDLDGKPIAPVPSRTQVSSPDGELTAETRPELLALCEHLADRIEANGSRRPRIGKRWLTAARLLVDVDGRTPDQVRAAIDWCQNDDFWRANVLSMPKLREKYDQLRLAASRSPRARDRQLDNLHDAYAWARQHDAAHAGNDLPAIGAI